MAEQTWSQPITKIEPNKVAVRGYRIDELMGRIPFAHVVYLALKGELPTESQGRVMDTILVSSVDHGATPPSVLAARTVASGGAPLTTGIARLAYLEQGTYYLLDTVKRETLLTLGIVAAAVGGVLSRSSRRRAVAAGMLLYIGYLVFVGGDFMRGRLLTPVLLAGVGLLLESDLFTRHRVRAALIGLVLLVGLPGIPHTILSGTDYGKDLDRNRAAEGYRGPRREQMGCERVRICGGGVGDAGGAGGVGGAGGACLRAPDSPVFPGACRGALSGQG